MKKIYLTLLLFALVGISQAQNWQTFRSGQEYYFRIPSTNKITGLLADSVQVLGTDSLLFTYVVPYDSLAGLFTGNCSVDTAASLWAGRRVLIDAKGWNIYLNDVEDSVYIQTRIQMGNVWTVYTDSLGNYYQAELTSMTQDTFAGLVDSIKTATIQVHDSTGAPITHPMNGETFSWSKKNGWVKSLHFLEVGKNSLPGTYKRWDFHHLTRGEIYDFDLGDEFQWILSTFGTAPDNYVAKTLVGKTVTGNSVEYRWARERINNTFVPNPQPHIFTSVLHDTVTETINNLDQFMQAEMPEETIYATQFGGIDHYWGIISTNYNSRKQMQLSRGEFLLMYPGCWASPFEPVYENFYYAVGLGRVHYIYSSAKSPTSSYEERLIYYKKENEESGNRYVVALDEERDLSPALQLFGNPVGTELQFSLELDQPALLRASVLDLQGRQLLSQSLSGSLGQNHFEMEVSQLSTGFYLLRLESGAGFAARKWIKL